MIRIQPGTNGVQVEADQGRIFPCDASGAGLRPRIHLSFLCDQIRGRDIWLPTDGPMAVRLDTGADTTCLHVGWMWRLGFKEDSADPEEFVQLAGDKAVRVRRKFACIRVAGFPDKIMIPIFYSAAFRDQLLVISFAALADHFGILLTKEQTIVLPK